MMKLATTLAALLSLAVLAPALPAAAASCTGGASALPGSPEAEYGRLIGVKTKLEKELRAISAALARTNGAKDSAKLLQQRTQALAALNKVNAQLKKLPAPKPGANGQTAQKAPKSC